MNPTQETNAEAFASLAPEMRLLRCRELTEEALERAAGAKTEVERAQLVTLANDYLVLAKEIEEMIRMPRRR
jgi:hypothetical protein